MSPEDGTFLAFVEPAPLFPDWEARLYDGQPRLKDGRFTYGKRAEVASSVGMAAQISIQDAEKALETPSVHSDACGRRVAFTGDLVRKYRDGVGRKGVDPARLRSLGRAVLAVRHPDTEVIELPHHNPPQRQYLYKFGGRGAIVVYVEVQDGKVRGFIYGSKRNADKFLAKKRGR